MRQVFIVVAFFFSFDLFACDRHISNAKEFRRHGEAAETVCALAAPAVLVFCPFCIVHGFVASAAACMGAAEFFDEEERSIKKYEECILAKAIDERNEREKEWLIEQERLAVEKEKKKKQLEGITIGSTIGSNFATSILD